MELTAEQTAELQRLKSYFPYRIVWCAKHPQTGEFLSGADTNKRRINKLVRQGFEGYLV